MRPLADLRPYLNAGRLFVGGDFAAAVAAQFGHVQLLNPVASGKTAILIACVSDNNAALNWGFCRYDTALVTNSAQVANAKLGGAAPSCQVRTATDAGALGTRLTSRLPTLNTDCLMGGICLLAAGQGVLVRSQNVNLAVYGQFWWIER